MNIPHPSPIKRAPRRPGPDGQPPRLREVQIVPTAGGVECCIESDSHPGTCYLVRVGDGGAAVHVGEPCPAAAFGRTCRHRADAPAIVARWQEIVDAHADWAEWAGEENSAERSAAMREAEWTWREAAWQLAALGYRVVARADARGAALHAERGTAA